MGVHPTPFRDFSEGSKSELIHLVQIYRLVVADVWDPYISLPFACYQFLENSFIDMVSANLGQGERNKAEYIERRLKALDPELRLLSGYDPIARNAVSHSGSHGVTSDLLTYPLRELSASIIWDSLQRRNACEAQFLENRSPLR